MLDAAIGQLNLIYHQTVQELRKDHANALVGLAMTTAQSVILIAGFMALFLLLGMRSSPIRGDYLVFMMTGVFLFITHIKTIAAVANCGKVNAAMLKHGPMTTAVIIVAAALAELYRQVLASILIFGVYHFIQPFSLLNPVGCLLMLLAAWAAGAAIGLVLMALRPWSPQAVQIIIMIFQRANMVFSGKMFAANLLPNAMFKMFAWNPLFHIIDQSRGYAFINYTPMKTSFSYPFYFIIAVTMIGLIAEFITRKHESLSWSAKH